MKETILLLLGLVLGAIAGLLNIIYVDSTALALAIPTVTVILVIDYIKARRKERDC